MLSNGSNPEGVMPQPPFVLKTKADLGVPMVHGPFLSPPVTKIRLYLIYSGVKYTQFQHFVSNSGIRPGPYTKVPSIDIDGRQLNDSLIILKVITPVLDLKLDLDWEKKFVLKLDTALKTMPTDDDWAKIAQKFIGMPACLAGIFAQKFYGPLERSQAANNIANSGLGHTNVDALELLKEFKVAMGKKAFVGGSQPGTPDLSLYGVLANFVYADCDFLKPLIAGSGLQDWLDGMQKVVSLKQLYDDVPASKW